MLLRYLARVVAKGIKPMAVKTHRNSVYARPGRWARVTTMPATKAPRHMSPVVCKFDITSVLVCLSCKAQTEWVRVDFLRHGQWVLPEEKPMEVNHCTCYEPYKNQHSLASQACGQALHVTEMTQYKTMTEMHHEPAGECMRRRSVPSRQFCTEHHGYSSFTFNL